MITVPVHVNRSEVAVTVNASGVVTVAVTTEAIAVAVPIASGQPGASAYQVAVANGFPGTAHDWLASLAGRDGSDGADGHSPTLTWVGDQLAIDGVATGPHLTGPQGDVGAKGDKGERGANGAFVQQTRPTEPGPWAWWVTSAEGRIVNLIINDGA